MSLPRPARDQHGRSLAPSALKYALREDIARRPARARSGKRQFPHRIQIGRRHLRDVRDCCGLSAQHSKIWLNFAEASSLWWRRREDVPPRTPSSFRSIRPLERREEFLGVNFRSFRRKK